MERLMERWVIFDAAEVRAALEGQKTQFRRALCQPSGRGAGEIGFKVPYLPEECPICIVDKLANVEVGWYSPTVVRRDDEEEPGPKVYGVYDLDGIWGQPCPYGGPGSLLRAKETWAYRLDCDEDPEARAWALSRPAGSFFYRADGGFQQTGCGGAAGRWRSSTTMPRVASRLTLEVTDVRVQQLQEISEDDARAEGYSGAAWWASSRELFAAWWDILSKRTPWDSNPIVWVVSFRRCQ